MKKVCIDEKCIACGMCQECKYVVANTDGTASVKGNGLIDQIDEKNVEKIKENCPSGAFNVVDIKETKKDVEALKREAKSIVSSFTLKKPAKTEFKYDFSKIDSYYPVGYGEYDYKYKSYGQAKEAGTQQIKKQFFDKRVGIVREIISEFLMQYNDYIEWKEQDTNYYYKASNKAQKVLEEFIDKARLMNSSISVNGDLAKIIAKPSKDELSNYAVGGGLLNAANGLVSTISSGCYSLSSYADYFDIDDMEEYTTGAFGREKIISKYCYCNLNEAFQSMIKDLKDMLEDRFDEAVAGMAYNSVTRTIDRYENMLKSELEKKMNSIIELV